MIALVTGGAGFIGVNFVRALLAQGGRVRVLDTLESAVPGGLDGLPIDLHQSDVRDVAAVRSAVAGVDAVFHLAAQTGVPISLERPDQDFSINVHGTFDLLQTCRAAGVKRFVLASSLAPLAGSPHPLDELSPVRPRSPYGAGKAAAEAYCLAFYEAFSLDTVVLRFANVYGPWSSVKTSVVAQFIRSGLDGRPLVVDGDGRQTRDFIHVSDLVTALVAAACAGGVAGGVYHIATGVETAVAEVAEHVRDHLALPLSSVTFGPRRAGDAVRSVADPSRARMALGWEPRIDITAGIANTCDWFVRRFTLARS